MESILLTQDCTSDDESESLKSFGKVALGYDESQLSSGAGETPQNGHDFLKYVQDERKSFPEVLVNEAGKKKGKDSSEKKTESDTAYRNFVVSNFSKLCKTVSDLREAASTIPGKVDTQKGLSDDSNGILEPSADETNDSSRTKLLKAAEEKAEFIVRIIDLGNRPKLSNLLRLSQLEVSTALEKLAEQSELSDRFSSFHPDWIYSLMAMLQSPLEADIYSTLRKIARACLRLKSGGGERRTSNLTCVEEELLLLICIIRHHFGQTDL